MIHAAGGGEKNTTPGRSSGPSGPSKRPQIGAAVTMIDTLAYTIKPENGHIWAFLACSDCAILHAILHGEPTQERETGAAQRPEALGGYYFTQSTIQHKVFASQSTILHKVFASRGVRTRPPHVVPGQSRAYRTAT